MMKPGDLFKRPLSQAPRQFVAPGRINLIGEHTDYNGGFVMPTAIDKHFTFAIAPNGTDAFRFYASDLDETASFTLGDLQPGHGWKNYLMGVIDGLVRRGKTPHGVDCEFSSTIPSGAGLSSSAALCSGFGFALNELFRWGLDRLELVKIAQESEHRFAGVKVGIMDMYASLFSKGGSVMLLDCREQSHEYLPLNLGDHEIVLIDTKVKHTLASSAYNKRRAACEEGVQVIQKKFAEVQALRDVTPSMLEVAKPWLNDEVYLRCHYIVHEINRTARAANFLKANNVTNFGKLMYETHWGLSKEYEVSCAESDFLVSLASENEVTGARQMGGGFGGCTINLIHQHRRAAFEELVRGKYFVEFKNEPEFYSVKLADGVHEVVGAHR
jgi:galactokinase